MIAVTSDPTAAPASTTSPLDTGTWRYERSCATWMYESTLPAGASPGAAVAACARGVLRALPGFAVPAAASWTTASAGDDAAAQSIGEPIDDAVVSETLQAHPDLIALALDLDLRVLAPDGTTEVTIRDGAVVHIELEDDELVLWVSLHVDLYAQPSFGPNRDNARLAALNAPVLAAFLARLVDETGARFHNVNAPGYNANPHGFA